ncbi:FixH family protein [Poseidonocella sedimentorum]|uniref:Nitrogen fixation protein FixH n=1 Tax=Poseidonocella sedimentorum TaxID=871652 RepID=A0A1I6DV11_9RHOB|nr:FixH family protein [Poseidonocella sedimentorum]SFR09266.1 Nitrogen fixation protein FixH [Poseidonocella sedimentorum]
MTEIKGWHVLAGFGLGFGIIIAVNLTLAFNAVRTFPGLEVRNSYVASQSFDADRAAQTALGWEVSAWLDGDRLVLEIAQDGRPVAPRIESAVFGRATNVTEDQSPAFAFDGTRHIAEVRAGRGNWNLRLVAQAEDGTVFQQRLVVETRR